jgi:HK97 family phage portal protein
MGLLSALGINKKTDSVQAQYAPAIMDTAYGYGSFTTGVGNFPGGLDRNYAMQVPAVNRCRNLIAGVISYLPLELYKKSTGEELASPVWLEQPDYRQPRSVTISWTVDSLLFYGIAYWRCTELYADDLRPSRFEWIANNRVTFTTNKFGTEVSQYYVDGVEAPMSGIGSLITFQGLTQGVLQTAARTIQSALDIEKAAAVSAQTPMPSGYIKNTGADLPEQQVSGLLAQWKQSRLNRSTAYLTSTLSYETTGFSPKDMMYNEAQQYLCTQIARAMNIPAYMISADMNNSMTYQNIIDGRKEFVAYSLQPFICAIEDRLSMDDITPRGHVVKFAIEESFLRADTMKRLEAIEKMLTLGLIDLDTAKEMEDMTPEGSESNDETYIR